MMAKAENAPDPTTPHAPLPEFRVVVKHGNGRGPLAPYRFVLVAAIALLTAGLPLWQTMQYEGDVDTALLRFGGIGLFSWIVLGKIDKILAEAPNPPQSALDHDARS